MTKEKDEVRGKRIDLRLSNKEIKLIKEAADTIDEPFRTFVRDAAIKEALSILGDE